MSKLGRGAIDRSDETPDGRAMQSVCQPAPAQRWLLDATVGASEATGLSPLDRYLFRELRIKVKHFWKVPPLLHQ
jgi:hypothetical protein